MTDMIFSHRPRRELAHRLGGGIEVTLYWSPDDNCTSVEIHHAASGQTLHLPVPRGRALDAFYHPFAHLQTPPGDAALVSELQT